MINAHWFPLKFEVQEGVPADWKAVISTDLESPGNFHDAEAARPLESIEYLVPSRSIVVLVRDAPRSS
jgi:hypothetical protein